MTVDVMMGTTCIGKREMCLHTRMSMLTSVLPATRKETGYWTENIRTGGRHMTLAGCKTIATCCLIVQLFILRYRGIIKLSFLTVNTDAMKFFQEVIQEISSVQDPVTACSQSGGGGAFYRSVQEMRSLGHTAEHLVELGFRRSDLLDAYPAKVVDALFSHVPQNGSLPREGAHSCGEEGLVGRRCGDGDHDDRHSQTIFQGRRNLKGQVLGHGVEENGAREHQGARRKAPHSKVSARSICQSITGEATPSMLYWQHEGKQLLPRWMACSLPSARLIVSLRDPIQRSYSDYYFFGRLQALKGHIPGVNSALQRAAYVDALNPEGFHNAMVAEVKLLSECFRGGDGGGRITWSPSNAFAGECRVVRRDQLEKLGFQSTRPPGRLLLSLYPLHMSSWLRHFHCSQMLILRSSGQWSEEQMLAAGKFLGLYGDKNSENEAVLRSIQRAAAAIYRGPESFKFNKKDSKTDPSNSAKDTVTQRIIINTHNTPMLNATHNLLYNFFSVHWHASFENEINTKEPCAEEMPHKTAQR